MKFRGDAMPVVYIDIVWAVNFVMDAVILMTSGWIAKRPVKPGRILLGSFIGACYALLLFVPSLSALTTWYGKAVASLIMVGLALPCKSWLELARVSVLFYFVAFVFAGAAIALHFALPGVSVASGTVIAHHGVAFLTSLQSLALLVAIPVSVAVIRYSTARVKALNLRHATLYDVTAVFNEVSANFVGLMDTGNQLRDPISRKPVCLVDGRVMKALLPRKLAEQLDAGSNMIDALQDIGETNYVGRLTVVPYRGAGGLQKVTIALRPDSVQLYKDKELVAMSRTCLLAVHEEPLSHEDRFQAILHTDLLTGDDGFESDFITSKNQYEASNSSATAMDSYTR
jgi:stage II sporulation protein GA (sporulation sigma-E factor processing peptidase)